VISVAFALLLAIGAAAPSSAFAMTTGRTSARLEAAPTFTLSAQVSGLYPNATLMAGVRVDNPQSYAISVRTASVTVGDANAGCTSANLTTSPFGGAVDVAANGSGTVPIRLHMLTSAPDACQGASFPLSFEATAVAGADPAAAHTPMPHMTAFTGAAGTIALALLGAILGAAGVVLVAATRRRSQSARGV
jgi:hypothetical protein